MTTTAIQAPPKPRRIRAELVWAEDPLGGCWIGRILNVGQARDQQRQDVPVERRGSGWVRRDYAVSIV